MPDGWDASLDTGSPRGLPGWRSWWHGGGGRGVDGLGGGRGDLLAGLWCLLGALLAGALIGLVWAAVSPRLDVAAVLDGSSAALDAQIGIDAYFGLICAGFGVLAGLLAFWRFADAGWPVPAGLAVGGFGGSLVAGWLGHQLRSDDVLDRLPPGFNQAIVDLVDVRVRSHGLYLVFPVVALFVLALGIWISSVRENGELAQAAGEPLEAQEALEPGDPGEPEPRREPGEQRESREPGESRKSGESREPRGSRPDRAD